jgi:hypothetical protein
MTTAKLINLLPMLIMVTFLGYTGYSIHASAGDPAGGESGLEKDLDSMLQNMIAVGDAIADSTSSAFRNPFQVRSQPAAVAHSDDVPPDPAVDTTAEIVQRLKLGATFVQGRDQMAIIDGRIYSKGQHLLIDGGSGKSSATLTVINILPEKVILHGGDKNYVLGYPDQLGGRPANARGEGSEAATAEIDAGGQLALFQKLLNGPLGALGKSLTGNPAGSSSRGGSGSRSRRSAGSRAANTATPNGNP